jgi:hypothetical protein
MMIDDKIVAETLLCEKNFECMKNNVHVYCRVEKCIDEKVHFIKCIDSFHCSYKLVFGYSNICTCPTRKEIFNKYSI